MNKKRPGFQIVLILAPVVLFSKLIFSGNALFWGTPSTQFIPWWSFAWRSVLEGQLPLWNPLLGMGAPLAANYQSALFYPPYWIYLPIYAAGGVSWMAWSVTLVVCAHLIWAGLGTARILKELRVGGLGQTIGGLAFSLSGYLVARAGFLSINAAVSWLPWILLGLLGVINKKKDSMFSLTASLAMLLLAGHAQTAWYCLLLGAVWCVFWSFQPGQQIQENWKRLRQGMLRYAGAGILAAGICAVQLIPTFEYLLNSQRAGEYGYNQAMTYSFWPWRILTLFAPDLFGNPAQGSYWGYGNYWEDAIYIGLLPFLLGLGFLLKAIFTKEKRLGNDQGYSDRKFALFLGGISVVSFILALGKNTPIYPFLYRYVPTFDLFQAPTRWLIWGVFSFSLLAGMGVDSLKKAGGRRLYVTRLAAAGCLAVIAGSLTARYWIDGLNPSFFVSSARAGSIGFLIVLLILAVPKKKDGRRYVSWSLAVVLLVASDLVLAGWGLNPGIEKDFYQENQASSAKFNDRSWIPAEDEYRLKYERYFLFDSFSPRADWDTMADIPLPNLNLLAGEEMVNNFDPLIPEHYQRWMDRLGSGTPAEGLLDMMDVSQIIRSTEGGWLIKDRDLPGDNRLRVVGCQEISNSSSAVLELIMQKPEKFIQDIAIISNEKQECVSGTTGTAEIDSAQNGYLKVNISVEKAGYLFWSESWYPGWIVKVDGGEASDSLPANYLFQAAAVPPGNHQVEFIYRPESFIWGGAATIFSLALGCILFIVAKKKY
jgi:hypothetical protein